MSERTDSTLTDEVRAAARQIVDRVGSDTSTPATGADAAVWTTLQDSGFTEIESDGDGTLVDLLAVVSVLAESGSLTPFLEDTVLARHIASSAGIRVPSTATLALADTRCTVDRTAEAITLRGVVVDVVLTDADHLLVALPDTDAESMVALVDLAAPGVTVHAGTDLVGMPVGNVEFDGVEVVVGTASMSVAEIRERGALAYAAALAAAAAHVLDASVTYAAERVQFGRPLTRFQAIAQRLAGLAGTAALMQAAVDVAIREYDATDTASGSRARNTRAVAAAKAVTSSCAREVAAAGHQIHGAIGFTSEHSLGRATTSLWTWRDRYGHEEYWAEELAGQIVDDGADVWDIIVGAQPDSTPQQGDSRS